jgi:hypothetical protein
MLKINDICFIVLTCDKYLNNRVESIKKSWGTKTNVIYLTDSKTSQANIVGYNTPLNYDGIQEKYYQFFLNFDFSNFKYFFFLDDDTFVNLKNLQKINIPNHDEMFCVGRELHLNIDGKDKWGNYTGYPMSKIKNKGTELPLIYPSGGSGFILSKSAVLKIQEYLQTLNENRPISGHSDVSIGFWMRNCQVQFIPSNLFWWDVPEKLINNTSEKFDNDNDFITYHYVDHNRMIEYHKKYNNDI